MPVQACSTHDAARIAGIKPKRLANLLDRQIIPAPRLGQGVHRQFRRDELVKIAIVDRLCRLGIRPVPAAAIAEQFHCAHGVLIVDLDGEARVAPPEEIEVPAAIIIVDLGRLQREIDTNLRAAVAA